jgi:multidrug efflux system membrane fusion protein
MFKKKRWLPFLILVAAAAVMLLLFGLNPDIVEKESSVALTPVEVMVLEAGNRQFIIESQGTVTAQDTTNLVAEVSGRVIEFADSFQVGRFFHKDEVLLHIDDLDYRALVEKARAVVAQHEAKLMAEMALARQAEADFKTLGKSGKVSELALRIPYVEEAKAQLASAQADLDRALIKLDRTRVKAPYDGYVLSREVGLGQYLAAGANIGHVFSARQALVRIPVTEQQLEMIAMNDRRHGVAAIPENLPAANQCDQLEIELISSREDSPNPRKAQICVLEATKDTENHVLYLQVQVEDPYLIYGSPDQADTPLRVGTYVIARIPSREYTNIFAIPRNAVYEGKKVLMVDEQDRLHWQEIEHFYTDAEYVYVRTGFSAGDRICISPLDVPVEGAQVAVQPAGLPISSNEVSTQ